MGFGIFLASLPAFADRQRVQVSKASVKSKPVGFVTTLATLDRGAEVDVLGAAGNGYVQVRAADGKTGYILAASLTTPERYKGIAKATSDEARQAGEATAAHGAAKGWDKPTEKEYAQGKNLEAEFKKVDDIEDGPFARQPAGEVERIVLQFAAEGKLGEAALGP